MFSGIGGESRAASITLVTDAFVVRGTILTRHRRITDMLNTAEHEFLVLEQATFDEFGSTGVAIQTDFAQVNLGAVLFGVADEPVEVTQELRVPKVSERALISVPPFTVTGHIHLMPGRDLHQALDELMGRFIPVTDAVYWSDRVGEARTNALIVAVNHNRAQILAPHREVDPWAGLDRSGESATSSGTSAGAAPGGGMPAAPPADPAWPEIDRPS
ncbi:MAG: hypothetical protein Q7S35_10035 [Candidatus Limnocylindrales bacterium]|nr:hypothetical protein [Candidatus Limnocylindrales bacterium]